MASGDIASAILNHVIIRPHPPNELMSVCDKQLSCECLLVSLMTHTCHTLLLFN